MPKFLRKWPLDLRQFDLFPYLVTIHQSDHVPGVYLVINTTV